MPTTFYYLGICMESGGRHTTIVCAIYRRKIIHKKVKVGNDHEIAQSERSSHSKKEMEEN